MAAALLVVQPFRSRVDKARAPSLSSPAAALLLQGEGGRGD